MQIEPFFALWFITQKLKKKKKKKTTTTTTKQLKKKKDKTKQKNRIRKRKQNIRIIYQGPHFPGSRNKNFAFKFPDGNFNITFPANC